jgi:hypothetical protein
MGDKHMSPPYGEAMAAVEPYISLWIDTKDPIELGDFVSTFTSIANQYEKFVREHFPDASPEAAIYVSEIRPGSIQAILVLIKSGAKHLVPHAMASIEKAVVEGFVKKYGERLASYFRRGGRDETASKSDLKDFMGAVRAIAHDQAGHGKIEGIVFEDGKRQIRAAVKFDTKEARVAEQEIEIHRAEIEATSAADHQRVLMVFSQSNVKKPVPGKRSGDRELSRVSPPRNWL